MKSIKKLLSFFVIIASLTFVSCENEPIDQSLLVNSTTGNGTGGNGTGGGNGSGGGGTSTGDYYPTAINNTWTLQQNGTNLAPNTIIGTEVISGSTYYKFNPTSTSGITLNTYVRKSNGSYFMKTGDSSLNFGGLTGTQTGFEFIILKDNISVGSTWNGTYNQTTTYAGIPAISQTTNYTGTILAKDVTETVFGETFNNVIKLKIDQVTSTSGTTTTVTTEYWFAKNVGPIKAISTSAGTTSTSILIDYTLF
jgi:hypothetical protein